VKNEHLNVGILGCSSFALRAMGPAVNGCPGLSLSAIASRNAEKALAAADKLQCRPVVGYEQLVDDPEIDVIYMPLPTGLHLEWGMKALRNGKHLLVEKALAGNAHDAGTLVSEASSRGLVLLENFLFLRHSQIAWVKRMLSEGTIGRLRLVRAAFTIPPLDDANFRYDGSLGGGALLDAGAYMVKTASAFLGAAPALLGATLETSLRRGVDIGGNAMFANDNGLAAQVAWAFDCHYQCSWDFLGEKGRIICHRALTPPPGLRPAVRLETVGKSEDLELEADDHYANQWQYFVSLANDPSARTAEYAAALDQAQSLQKIADHAIRKTIP